MFRTITRYLILTLVALGIVAPQASASLSALGLADGRIMVICTGDGLRTLHINEDGEPVELSDSVDVCALLNVVGTAASVSPDEIRQRVLFETDRAIAQIYPVVSKEFSLSLPRAPPLG